MFTLNCTHTLEVQRPMSTDNLMKMKANILIFINLLHMFTGSAEPGTSFRLTNVAQDRCLSVINRSCLPFIWTSGDRLMLVMKNKCLGVPGNTPGSEVNIYDCNENSELQKWECRNSTLIALKGQELYIAFNMNLQPTLTSTVSPANHFVIRGTQRGACTETFRELFTIGGNANGRPCMFPFFYKDNWVAECTSVDSTIKGREWCSVQTRFDEELWGYCPTQSRDKWEKHPVTGHYYQVNADSTLTWSQAKKSCNQQGASLLSITDPHEHTYISGLLSQEGAKLWTGLMTDSEHGWHWSDERPYRYLNWDSGYPGLTPGHVCGYLDPDSQYSWRNAPCSKKFGYICYSGATPQRPTPKPADVAEFCSSPWIPYNGHCFLLSRNQMSWSDAHGDCRTKGGDLVSIHNVEEQGFVISQLGYGPSDELWIGLNDKRTRNLFDWSDHSTVSYTSWEYMRPEIHSNNQKCVLVRGEQGNWADRSCEEKHGFICMKPSSTQQTGEEVQVDKGCKSGWKRHGSYCYLVGTQTKTFAEAGEHCKSSASYLADVSNGVDNAFLVSLVGTRPEKYFWLGLSNQKDLEVFEWTNTPFVKFTHWNAEMPGNTMGCVAMTTGVFAGLWDVLPCTNEEKYICKHLAEDASLTPAPPTLKPPRCAEGWTRVGRRNVCFKEFLDSSFGVKSWYEARGYCQVIGGDLLSLHSIEELQALPYKNMNVWIGLSAPDTKTYVWSDGSPLQFHHWVTGQPDNKNSVESCAELDLGMMLHEGGSWSDVQCEKHNRWLCQIPAGLSPKSLPKPSTPDFNVTSDGWREWRGHQYYFDGETKAMDDARVYCRRRHGDLVTIKSEAENLFLWKQITETYTDFWIGLNVDLDGSFQWMDGSLVTFEKWGKDQPLFKNNDENCVFMTSSTGFWQDHNCGRALHFICKRSSSAPINATVAPTDAPLQGGCPENWDKLKSKCYRIVKNKMETWEGAKTSCREMGGKLASIHSRHEHVFLKTASVPGTDMWLGLTSDGGREVYWTDGRALTYSAVGYKSWWDMSDWNWETYHMMMLTKACYAMTSQIGKWIREPCNDTKAYICQRNVDPAFPDVPPIYTDYIKVGNDSFKVVPQKLTWGDAKKHCEDDGATLASLLDKLSESYVSLMTLTFNSSVWLGLSKTEAGGHFRYIDGWQMSIYNWGRMEPSPDRPCVYVDIDGEWKTSYCNQTNYSVCKKSTAVPPTSSDVHPGVCPDVVVKHSHTAWLPFKNYCYKFTEIRHWWTDASGLCRKYGGHLASIEDIEEQRFLESHAKIFEDSTSSFWIGLYKTSKGTWLWEDRAVVDYINMPLNDSDEKGYAVLRTSDGKWHADPVYRFKPFICKTGKVLPPSPTPGTQISEPEARRHIFMAIALVIGGLAAGLVIVFVFYKYPRRRLPMLEQLTNFDNPLFFHKEELHTDVVDNNIVITAADDEQAM